MDDLFLCAICQRAICPALDGGISRHIGASTGCPAMVCRACHEKIAAKRKFCDPDTGSPMCPRCRAPDFWMDEHPPIALVMLATAQTHECDECGATGLSPDAARTHECAGQGRKRIDQTACPACMEPDSREHRCLVNGPEFACNGRGCEMPVSSADEACGMCARLPTRQTLFALETAARARVPCVAKSLLWSCRRTLPIVADLRNTHFQITACASWFAHGGVSCPGAREAVISLASDVIPMHPSKSAGVALASFCASFLASAPVRAVHPEVAAKWLSGLITLPANRAIESAPLLNLLIRDRVFAQLNTFLTALMRVPWTMSRFYDTVCLFVVQLARDVQLTKFPKPATHKNGAGIVDDILYKIDDMNMAPVDPDLFHMFRRRLERLEQTCRVVENGPQLACPLSRKSARFLRSAVEKYDAPPRFGDKALDIRIMPRCRTCLSPARLFWRSCGDLVCAACLEDEPACQACVGDLKCALFPAHPGQFEPPSREHTRCEECGDAFPADCAREHARRLCSAKSFVECRACGGRHMRTQPHECGFDPLPCALCGRRHDPRSLYQCLSASELAERAPDGTEKLMEHVAWLLDRSVDNDPFLAREHGSFHQILSVARSALALSPGMFAERIAKHAETMLRAETADADACPNSWALFELLAERAPRGVPYGLLREGLELAARRLTSAADLARVVQCAMACPLVDSATREAICTAVSESMRGRGRSKAARSDFFVALLPGMPAAAEPVEFGELMGLAMDVSMRERLATDPASVFLKRVLDVQEEEEEIDAPTRKHRKIAQ